MIPGDEGAKPPGLRLRPIDYIAYYSVLKAVTRNVADRADRVWQHPSLTGALWGPGAEGGRNA